MQWARVERIVRVIDGLALALLLGGGLFVLGIAVTTGYHDAYHGGAYVWLAGLMLTLFGFTFLPPYLGMRYRTRWRWYAHLVPVAAPWLLERLFI